MGTWGFLPWEDDLGSDWLGDMMAATGLRDYVMDTIRNAIDHEAGEVRAAIAVFVLMGRVYVWPVEHYAEDLTLAISTLRQIRETPEYLESAEMLTAIDGEMGELESRLEKRDAAEPPSGEAWWKLS